MPQKRNASVAFDQPAVTPTDTSMIFSIISAAFGAGAQFVSPADNTASKVGAAQSATTGTAWIANTAGTFRNLRVDGDNNVVTNALDFTVNKGGVDSAVTVHIPIGSKSGSDTTHSLVVAAGDLVSIHTSAHVGDEFGLTMISLDFTP